ncbi:acyl carrier protein [Desulfomicrobium orale]|uniref:Acyl carrier protein n=1 Tax=Desulfomicrobium orale DSM 12838 TaxID=888061 RepID=A0A0X8JPV6_9BACT|nr:phosphopantetheine-binding protein [Desulfomicrobium orale]AMD92740.1 acyl carrier protein [Desulfomicrobium orale DSM 12838]MDO4766962.1 phosphopantetheine-binding protein [Pseudomonadota bacterium]
MTNEEVIARTNAAIATEFELDPSALKPEASFKDDLGLDSLDAVDMVIVLEQEFGVKIGKDPRIAAIRNLADLHAFMIEKKQAMDA